MLEASHETEKSIFFMRSPRSDPFAKVKGTVVVMPKFIEDSSKTTVLANSRYLLLACARATSDNKPFKKEEIM